MTLGEVGVTKFDFEVVFFSPLEKIMNDVFSTFNVSLLAASHDLILISSSLDSFSKMIGDCPLSERYESSANRFILNLET